MPRACKNIGREMPIGFAKKEGDGWIVGSTSRRRWGSGGDQVKSGLFYASGRGVGHPRRGWLSRLIRGRGQTQKTKAACTQFSKFLKGLNVGPRKGIKTPVTKDGGGDVAKTFHTKPAK